MTIGRHTVYLLGALVVVGVLVPPAGWGQAVKARREALVGSVEIEEITVTAQKREENIQEIPISVTAVAGGALEEKGVRSLSDLYQAVPNLFVTTGTTQSSATTIGMRGTQMGDNSLSQNPAVGLYVDGVYISKAQFSNLDIEDLERVEVLRGPQGTLYGKNTIGGAVNMITKKPTEKRAAMVATEVGNYSAFKGRVTLNVPLIGHNGFFQSDALGTLSLRENVSYRSHDPYVKNVSPTTLRASGGSGMLNMNRVFNMTSLRWQPRDGITIDYAVEYHRYRNAAGAVQISYIYPNSFADVRSTVTVQGKKIIVPNPFVAGGLTPYVRTNRVLQLGNNSLFTTSDGLTVSQKQHRMEDSGNHRMHFLTATWELGELGPLGNVTLKSIAGYRATTADSASDIDGSPVHFYDSLNHFRLTTWSEELQWIATARRVHYVLGAYYFGDRTSEKSSQVLLNGASPSLFINHGKDSSSAAFGQLTWTPPILGDKLSVTAGLRFSYDHTSFSRWYRSRTTAWYGSVAKGFGIHGTGLPGLSPMADVSYQWTDNFMAYFRVSRGYMTGVANGRAGDPLSFSRMANPEKLLAYEAGFKSQWFDNRLRLNADGFFSDYKDKAIAIVRFTPGGSINSLENVGAEEMWGSEVELTAIPLRGLETSLAYAYLTAEYTKWIAPKFDALNNPLFDPVTGQQIFEDVANQRVQARAPEHTITVGCTYTAPPTATGVFSAHLDTYWSDSFFNNSSGIQANKSSSYAVVNGRLQFVEIPLQKGSLDVAVFARNLFDRKYRTFGFDLTQALGWQTNTYGDPRTFGLSLTYHFTAS